MSAPPDVAVVDTQGHLPPFWDEDVLFFANLLGLFFGNDRQMQELRDTVGEVDSYGGRLVPILCLLFGGARNTLVLERACGPALCRYFSDDLGLRLPDRFLLPHDDYEELGHRCAHGGAGPVEDLPWLPDLLRHPASRIDGYVTDRTLAGLAQFLGKPTVNTPEACWRGNNKLMLHRFLQAAGLPVIDFETAARIQDVPPALERLSRRGFRAAVLKSQIGASGIGLLKWDDVTRRAEDLLARVPDHFFHEGEILVQGWLGPGVHGVTSVVSPSVQLFLDETSVFLYDLTEQILSHASVHEGNVSPPPFLARHDGSLGEELFRQAGIVGRWLHGEGYRGTASIDFLVAEGTGPALPGVYVCEVNARVTGATYPSVLARHFTPRGAWLMRNLRLSRPLEEAELLHLLARPDHLYHPDRDRGILPVNFNLGPDGRVHKGQFLCLAPRVEDCLAHLGTAETDLPVTWEADRD
jgi:hypothetical protein